MTDVLARLTGVRKRYGPVTALDGLDLTVGEGELLALLGPNGAGKSTAIALMLGLQQPDEGEAALFGLSPLDVRARRGVGVMMQEVTLAAELQVRELVAQISSYYPDPLKVEATLRRAGVEAIARRRYGKLSGGQKRQVQFALAICGRPRLLFLDEPTVGLDLQARETMWSTLRELVAEGVSMVLTTHYLEEAEALADRVVVLAGGRAIADGAVRDMRNLVSSKRVECVTRMPLEEVRAWPEVGEASTDDGRLSLSTTQAEAVVRRLLAADKALSELEVRRAGLSEAFAHITQEHAR